MAFGKSQENFLVLVPGYWREHWDYTKWVLATAFVVQLDHAKYYWLVAGFLSAAEVGELRAVYLIVAPIEQALIAISYLVVPALAADYAANKMGHFFSVWKRYALTTVGMTGLFALVVRMAGRPTMHVLLCGKFDDNARFFSYWLFAPGYGTWQYDGTGVKCDGKAATRIFGFLSSGVATFLVGIPLVMHLGLRGTAYGMLLSGGTYTAAMGICFLFSVPKNGYCGSMNRVQGRIWPQDLP